MNHFSLLGSSPIIVSCLSCWISSLCRVNSSTKAAICFPRQLLLLPLNARKFPSWKDHSKSFNLSCWVLYSEKSFQVWQFQPLCWWILKESIPGSSTNIERSAFWYCFGWISAQTLQKEDSGPIYLRNGFWYISLHLEWILFCKSESCWPNLKVAERLVAERELLVAPF